MAVWSLTLAGRTRAVIAPLSIAICAYLTWAWGPKAIGPAPAALTASDAPAGWQPWQADLPGQLLAEGKPVFVDFTAAWCVTCQYNKQTTLSDPDVLAALAAKQVTLLRADWTRRDAQITAALAKLGRSGVPVYVLMAPGKPPVVFSEVLGRKELTDAVNAI